MQAALAPSFADLAFDSLLRKPGPRRDMPRSGAPAAMLRAVSRPTSADAAKEAELAIERTWVDRAREGDRGALRSILEKYGPTLYRGVLLPRLSDEARARDALADTYARVVASIARYEWHPAGIYPWLRTIAFHVAIDALRARKRETPFEVEDLEREVDRRADVEGTDAVYLSRVEAARARTKVEAALQRINPRYASAIRLRVIEERPREEVARMLDATPATFDVILHRAMAAMRKALAEVAPDSDRRGTDG